MPLIIQDSDYIYVIYVLFVLIYLWHLCVRTCVFVFRQFVADQFVPTYSGFSCLESQGIIALCLRL